TQIAVNAGNAQSATAGSTVSVAPAVVVRDANSNPVSGVNVTFAVTGGGGSTVPASGSVVTTDASGIAALTSWTVGTTAGANSLTATSGVLTGSPVTFTATGTAGSASTATTTISASPTTVIAGGSTTITVQLQDGNGNNLTASGGSVALATTRGSLTGVSD